MPEKKKKEKAFIANYKIYKDKIYTYFLYRVNFNREIAEDLTSAVFLKAFASLDSFDRARPFQSWIYAISHNHLLNYYRTVGRETNLEQAEKVVVEFSRQFDAKLGLEKVIAEIYKLDKYSREVLLLRFIEGLNNNEIAELLDKDEGAVRTQISRALSELRKKINLNA